LLKEIHHRVKNNLQVISSLLHMQGDLTNVEAACELFRESENRVLSMAAIHESLYGAPDFSRVDLSEYLRRVVDLVATSYQAAGVTCVVEGGEGITVTMNSAMPCGLIVNELVSNALKHAFGGAAGQVTVSIRRAGAGVSMAVEDNGRGLPENFRMGNSSGLGLQLVQTLTRQISGTARAVRGNGTRFEIDFEAA